MKITFIFITVVIVWMCCLITDSASDYEWRGSRQPRQLSAERVEKFPRHLNITTILNRPFMMLKEEATRARSGNDRYEGFLVDLVQQLAETLNFTYTISVVKDKKYGGMSSDGVWNGMIKEVLDEDADLAVADLTMTAIRQQVVDFTIPFMTSGIGILMKKPAAPSLQSLFLMPYSSDVWISSLVAFSVMSALLFIMGRVNSTEWVNTQSSSTGTHHRHNNLNLCNSLWFSFASLTQQGSRVAPRAISTRILSATWWIFCFFFVGCYIANLAAILVHQLESSAHGAEIQSVEDLARQTNVKYGTIRGGSTQAFFKFSQVDVYQRMFAFMESTTPTPYVKTYDEGIQRAKQGGYALFMESASINYITERDCELTQVGGLLDFRGYGIAMKDSSQLARPFSVAILQLQDKGTLLALRTKWWSVKEGSCKAQPKKDSSRGALTMESLGSVFHILILGCVLSLLIAVVELFWKAKKTSKTEGGSLCKEVMRELKFGVCGGNVQSSGQGEGVVLQ